MTLPGPEGPPIMGFCNGCERYAPLRHGRCLECRTGSGPQPIDDRQPTRTAGGGDGR